VRWCAVARGKISACCSDARPPLDYFGAMISTFAHASSPSISSRANASASSWVSNFDDVHSVLTVHCLLMFLCFLLGVILQEIVRLFLVAPWRVRHVRDVLRGLGFDGRGFFERVYQLRSLLGYNAALRDFCVIINNLIS